LPRRKAGAGEHLEDPSEDGVDVVDGVDGVDGIADDKSRQR